MSECTGKKMEYSVQLISISYCGTGEKRIIHGYLARRTFIGRPIKLMFRACRLARLFVNVIAQLNSITTGPFSTFKLQLR